MAFAREANTGIARAGDRRRDGGDATTLSNSSYDTLGVGSSKVGKMKGCVNGLGVIIEKYLTWPLENFKSSIVGEAYMEDIYWIPRLGRPQEAIWPPMRLSVGYCRLICLAVVQDWVWWHLDGPTTYVDHMDVKFKGTYIHHPLLQPSTWSLWMPTISRLLGEHLVAPPLFNLQAPSVSTFKEQRRGIS